jgi:hypothetical protein
MTKAVERLLEEIAPALERLVQREVERAVTRKMSELSKSAPGGRPVWRGAYVAGLAYGQDALVAHDGRLYRAMDVTTEAPGPTARAWRVHAETP